MINIRKGRKPTRYRDNEPRLGVDNARKMQSKTMYTSKESNNNRLALTLNTLLTAVINNMAMSKFSREANKAIKPDASHTNGRSNPENNAHGAFKITLAHCA